MDGNMMSRTPEQQRRDAEVQSTSIHRPTAARGMQALQSIDRSDLEGMRQAAGERNSMRAAEANMYGADQSLRANMYSADQRVAAEHVAAGAKAQQAQQAMAQRQAMGQIFKAAGGDWTKASQMAASFGMDPKAFMDQAAAEQALGERTAEQARKPFEASSTTRDKDGNPTINPALVAQHEAVANQITGGNWRNLPEPERAKRAPEVVANTKMLQGMNSLRNNTWAQAVGLDAPTPELSQLPSLRGANLSQVGLWDAAFTPKVSRNDYKLSSGLRDYYIPNDAMSDQTLNFLEKEGVSLRK